MRSALFVFGLISASYLPAQQTSLSGPVQAVTFDAPTRSIREVLGLPGAASFGPALLDNLDLASIAPLQNYGIAFEGQRCLFVSGLGTKTVSTAIAGVNSYPDGIVWSGNGSVAVLYSLAGGWFQPISGFPAAPVAGMPVDLSSLGGSFSAIALDVTGDQIAAGISGQAGGVYQAAGGQLAKLVSAMQPISLSFSADGKTLYALDAATSEVIATYLDGSGNESLSLPGLSNPIAIQSLQDSQGQQVLYVAGGSDRLLRILNPASQQIVADVPLNFQPTTVGPFSNSSFVLASRSQSANPLWLFTSTPQPDAYFVPAVRLEPPDLARVTGAGRTR